MKKKFDAITRKAFWVAYNKKCLYRNELIDKISEMHLVYITKVSSKTHSDSFRKLLNNLAELKLIKISDSTDRKNEFKKLLERLRSKSDNVPSIEEITKEVESVRKERYEK